MLQNSISKRRSLAPLLFLCLSLTACMKVGPYVDPPESDPLPEGPGLFTGEKGYYSPNDDSENSEEKPVSTESTISSSTDDFEEFEAYQRWKTEERQSDEYREFKQWLEFKKWKSQQDK